MSDRLLQISKPYMKGDDVKRFQRALNKRARSRFTNPVKVDGEYGPTTHRAAVRVAYFLGLLKTEGSPEIANRRMRIIRFPGTRTPAEVARGRTRLATKKKANKASTKGPQAALKEGRKYLGKTESPYGSNTAPWGLGAWIKHFLGLNYGVAWCGIYVGHCLEAAGVKVTSRIASVYLTYVDAGNGANGFVKRVGAREGIAGDAIGLFTTSTHIEIIEKPVPGGYQTLGGNTSSGNNGSQSNGGGVYRRFRPYGDVAYIARPKY